jgi:hypothetical protein
MALSFIRSLGEKSGLLVLRVEKRLTRTKYLAKDITGRCILDLRGVEKARRREILCKGTSFVEGVRITARCHIKRAADMSKNGSFRVKSLMSILYAEEIERFTFRGAVHAILG